MKVEKEKIFTPLKIIIETESELKSIINFIEYLQMIEEDRYRSRGVGRFMMYEPSATVKDAMRLKQLLKND